MFVWLLLRILPFQVLNNESQVPNSFCTSQSHPLPPARSSSIWRPPSRKNEPVAVRLLHHSAILATATTMHLVGAHTLCGPLSRARNRFAVRIHFCTMTTFFFGVSVQDILGRFIRYNSIKRGWATAEPTSVTQIS